MTAGRDSSMSFDREQDFSEIENGLFAISVALQFADQLHPAGSDPERDRRRRHREPTGAAAAAERREAAMRSRIIRRTAPAEPAAPPPPASPRPIVMCYRREAGSAQFVPVYAND